jgi:predicted DNA-binding transcriptional regulator YafY
MTSDSMDWPALALGSIGAEFEIVQPLELVEHIREWAARFGRAVRGAS